MIRAAIVEGEPEIRSDLSRILERTGRVQVVGEAESAPAGLQVCRASAADAVFVAMRLPERDGLWLGRALSGLPSPPLVVFLARRVEYAVDAFELHAADYLMKPLDPRRVESAVQHLELRMLERQAAATAEHPTADEHLPVRLREKDSARLLSRDEIVAVLRRGRRTWIHTRDAEFPTYYPVSEVQEWLADSRFFRAGRNAVVNLRCVAEIVHYGDRLYQLRLHDRARTTVPVSRSAGSALAHLLRAPFPARTARSPAERESG